MTVCRLLCCYVLCRVVGCSGRWLCRHAAPLDNCQMIPAICARRILPRRNVRTAAAGGPVRRPPPVTVGLRAAPALFSPRPIRRGPVKAAAHVTSHPLCNATDSGARPAPEPHSPQPIHPARPAPPSPAPSRLPRAPLAAARRIFSPFRRH